MSLRLRALLACREYEIPPIGARRDDDGEVVRHVPRELVELAAEIDLMYDGKFSRVRKLVRRLLDREFTPPDLPPEAEDDFYLLTQLVHMGDGHLRCIHLEFVPLPSGEALLTFEEDLSRGEPLSRGQVLFDLLCESSGITPMKRLARRANRPTADAAECHRNDMECVVDVERGHCAELHPLHSRILCRSQPLLERYLAVPGIHPTETRRHTIYNHVMLWSVDGTRISPRFYFSIDRCVGIDDTEKRGRVASYIAESIRDLPQNVVADRTCMVDDILRHVCDWLRRHPRKITRHSPLVTKFRQLESPNGDIWKRMTQVVQWCSRYGLDGAREVLLNLHPEWREQLLLEAELSDDV